MQQAIVFLSPPEYEGRTGYQNVDDDSHELINVTFEDGTVVPNAPGFSYKAAD